MMQKKAALGAEAAAKSSASRRARLAASEKPLGLEVAAQLDEFDRRDATRPVPHWELDVRVQSSLQQAVAKAEAEAKVREASAVEMAVVAANEAADRVRAEAVEKTARAVAEQWGSRHAVQLSQMKAQSDKEKVSAAAPIPYTATGCGGAE